MPHLSGVLLTYLPQQLARPGLDSQTYWYLIVFRKAPPGTFVNPIGMFVDHLSPICDKECKTGTNHNIREEEGRVPNYVKWFNIIASTG